MSNLPLIWLFGTFQEKYGYIFDYKAPKNWARVNRKTLKRPKMMSKLNFRNLKLKIREIYLRILVKDLKKANETIK